MTDDLQKIAARALGLIDLTNLNDDCTAEDITALCAATSTPHGKVAAVCVWPDFVAQCMREVGEGSGIAIATVVNFPGGDKDRKTVLAETKKAVADGATEVDMVLPYHALASGDVDLAGDTIAMVRAATSGRAKLKVIIESGELKAPDLIRAATRLALDEDADFVKTSTGKVDINATPETADIMLGEIKQFGDPKRGFKAAGGIRTVEDCAAYFAIADDLMGHDWVEKSTFRFGASSLLGNVLEVLDGTASSAGSDSGY
ncbi:MAG: deoxyribose-phosphate aldolase [Pseudomonadota bacterium]